MLKTLVSLADANAHIPVLSSVRVLNGIAETTNMDFSVSCPVSGIKDGFYHHQGFDKNIQIPMEESAPGDFPELTKGKTVKATTVFNKKDIKNLNWVRIAESTEETRYYLKGLFFDWSEEHGMIVATDGHRLHGIRHTIEAKRPEKARKTIVKQKRTVKHIPMKGEILPSKGIKLIINMMKETGAPCAEISIYKTRFMAKIGKAVIWGKLIDGTYPEWRRVVPNYHGLEEFIYPDENVTDFDVDQIKAALPELKVLASINGNGGSSIALGSGTFETTQSHTKTSLSWPTTVKFNGDLKIEFNINYLSNLCSGKLFYKDAISPICVVDDGDVYKVACLMPLLAL